MLESGVLRRNSGLVFTSLFGTRKKKRARRGIKFRACWAFGIGLDSCTIHLSGFSNKHGLNAFRMPGTGQGSEAREGGTGNPPPLSLIALWRRKGSLESAVHSWESACPCPVALGLFHGACKAPFLAKGLPVQDPALQEVVFLASAPSSEPLPPPRVSHLCEPSPSSHNCCWAFSQGRDSDSQDTLMACCHPTPFSTRH